MLTMAGLYDYAKRETQHCSCLRYLSILQFPLDPRGPLNTPVSYLACIAFSFPILDFPLTPFSAAASYLPRKNNAHGVDKPILSITKRHPEETRAMIC